MTFNSPLSSATVASLTPFPEKVVGICSGRGGTSGGGGAIVIESTKINHVKVVGLIDAFNWGD